MGGSTERVMYRAAGAVGAGAIAAFAVAVVRFRATEIPGARFEHPLAGGVKDEVIFYNAGPWIAHFEVWAGAALALAVCALLLAAIARFGNALR